MVSMRDSPEVLANLSRKKLAADKAKERSYRRLQQVRKEEARAQEALEDVVGFVLDGKHASLRAIARELGCSRDKVLGMAARSRQRNVARLRAGHG